MTEVFIVKCQSSEDGYNPYEFIVDVYKNESSANAYVKHENALREDDEDNCTFYVVERRELKE